MNSDQQSKEKSEKDTSSETKKRRHPTGQDENDEENMEPSGERSVKPKVIKAFKEIYLEMDMAKKDAEEELKETKKNFTHFMKEYNRNPQRAHPELTECERASLAHVDPDVNLEEEEFYVRHRRELPSMDEFRKAQPASGYPIKLPLGLKKLNAYDKPEVIQAFADPGISDATN